MADSLLSWKEGRKTKTTAAVSAGPTVFEFSSFSTFYSLACVLLKRIYWQETKVKYVCGILDKVTKTQIHVLFQFANNNL